MLRLFVAFALTAMSAAAYAEPRADFDARELTNGVTLVRVFPEGYWLSSDQSAALPGIVRGLKQPVVIVLWAPYVPQVIDESGESSKLFPHRFAWFLHKLCYQDVNYEDPQYREIQRSESHCYADRAAEYLEGRHLPFWMHSVWGESMEHYSGSGFYRYPLYLLTLVFLSLPQLALFLLLLVPLRPALRTRPFPQRLVKVLLPLVLGVAWFLLWIYLWKGTKLQPWYISPFHFVVPLSGIFFALTFLPSMWIADYVLFPENEPPSLTVVIIFYVLAPLLVFAAGGAARGASGVSVGARRDSSGGTSSASGAGGSFGGGGASGSF